MPTNPPPKTVPSKSVMRKYATDRTDVEITVEILADGTDKLIKNAQTKFESFGASKSTDGKWYFALAPGYKYEEVGGEKLITEVIGSALIKGTIKIQTSYGKSARATDTSAYGRGTTEKDETNGNTSLGFHESKHRENYIDHIRNVELPDFSGHIGMTVNQFKTSSQEFITSVDAWFIKMESDSESLTDEVGYKKSTYDKNGPRP